MKINFIVLAFFVMIQMSVKADFFGFIFPSTVTKPKTWFEIYKYNLMDNELKANLFKYLKAKKHSMIIGKRSSLKKNFLFFPIENDIENK